MILTPNIFTNKTSRFVKLFVFYIIGVGHKSLLG
jgi:hypothetical protein